VKNVENFKNGSISIEIFGDHRLAAKTGRIRLPFVNGITAGDAFDRVRKNYPEIDLDEKSIIITVNHVVASHDKLLKPDDIVSFLPHIGGG
jgi:molybdopterin converting factor small subunit